MKIYIILAQVGNSEDWTWDEVDRTTNEAEALEAQVKGAKIIVEETDPELEDAESLIDGSPFILSYTWIDDPVEHEEEFIDFDVAAFKAKTIVEEGGSAIIFDKYGNEVF